MTTPQQMPSQFLDQASRLVTTMTETWAGAARAGGPQGDALPGPSEFVDQFFDFWVQLLEAQRGLVLSGIHALAPSVSAPVEVAPPAPSTTTARTAESTADERIGGAAADAITTAATITAAKTATVTTSPAPTKAPAPGTTPAPSSTTAARTAESTADEHIGGAAADAITTAAAITAEKTSAPRKTSAATKTSAAEKPSSKKAATAEKASPKKAATAEKTTTAKKKRS